MGFGGGMTLGDYAGQDWGRGNVCKYIDLKHISSANEVIYFAGFVIDKRGTVVLLPVSDIPVKSERLS